MITSIARFISIVGHPALLMPIAAAIAANSIDNHRVQLLAVIVAIFFAIFVFTYSQVKTRTGQWEHVDASLKNEHKELNISASVFLFIGTLVLFLFDVHSGIVFAVGLSGAIVLCCYFLSKIAKPSLHFGFAILASCLIFPNVSVATFFLFFAVLVGWSRFHLERHTRLDLAIGAGLGLFAGISFQFLVHIVNA
ncbi:putative PAP2 superfamily [Cellvibrio japonicus]|uniref:Putative PAP2 superfamily n=1 Tax=Cellvibrio japonicus (strain Ueda107) TaxID=498211 RepID=B3PDX9_CELJU|nr:putative PAP2 superfamily [Cellvibrio japonicus]ACE83775.1 putative PAP2 superfamily [Cellvibrio japonicus Ueda107]QEI13459.1 hypothetical protein FY117_15315 [Cellvibrio japonicus]QEI17033.1 hypothetical protein FY116_15320 [Cellvibrio japonicus]QEI20611.1 hypothetical protein FY115_15315 [Cellvibrio japonicus]